ncbi:hypothetical protein HanHA89_Chr16g0667151 [Helianthus annuus]|nr:hypothetical protein HanHA89_Chr16g0667151 [Helianthus annuus]
MVKPNVKIASRTIIPFHLIQSSISEIQVRSAQVHIFSLGEDVYILIGERSKSALLEPFSDSFLTSPHLFSGRQRLHINRREKQIGVAGKRSKSALLSFTKPFTILSGVY